MTKVQSQKLVSFNRTPVFICADTVFTAVNDGAYMVVYKERDSEKFTATIVSCL